MEITINPTADAYVDGDNPDSNYGTLSELRVNRYSPYEIFLEGTIPDLSIDTIILKLYAFNVSYSGSSTQDINIVASSISWYEDEITYNNRPGTFGSTETFPIAMGIGWKDFNVTSLISGNPGDTFSLKIFAPGTSDYTLKFYSKEGDNLPYLVFKGLQRVRRKLGTKWNNAGKVRNVLSLSHKNLLHKPEVTFIQANFSPKQESSVSTLRFYSKDMNEEDASYINPVPSPYWYGEGLWDSNYFYSAWKHVGVSINFQEGSIVGVKLYPFDDFSNRILVGIKDSTIDSCPESSYDVVRGIGHSGFPIDSTILSSLGHAYYRNESSPYTFLSNFSSTDPYTLWIGSESTSPFKVPNYVVLQFRTPHMAITSNPWGEEPLPEKVAFRYLGGTLRVKVYHAKEDTLTWEYNLPMTITVSSLTIPAVQIFNQTIMLAISGYEGIGTLTAWSNKAFTETSGELFNGTPYFGNNSMLRACVVASDVEPSSTAGSFPSGWSSDSPSSTTFQLKGTIHTLELPSLSTITNQTRIAIRMLIPHDLPYRGTISFYLKGPLNSTIYANASTNSVPYWVKATSFFFSGRWTGFRRTTWAYPITLDPISIPYSSFGTVDTLWAYYNREDWS